MTQDLERRLRRVEDVQELSRLKWRYADALDHGFDLDALLSCFLPEARWSSVGFGDCTGHDAIRAYFVRVARVTPQVLHYTTNPLVTVESDDRATIHAYLLCLATVTDRTGVPREKVLLGTYEDVCVRRDGSWLFEHVRVDVRINEDRRPGDGLGAAVSTLLGSAAQEAPAGSGPR